MCCVYVIIFSGFEMCDPLYFEEEATQVFKNDEKCTLIVGGDKHIEKLKDSASHRGVDTPLDKLSSPPHFTTGDDGFSFGGKIETVLSI